MKFYLDVADNPKIILKYAKKNKNPGPLKDFTYQDLGQASNFLNSGQGWVKLYIKKYPTHQNTKRLFNILKNKNHILSSLVKTMSQKGKSSEWISVNTKCFYLD